MDFFSKNNLKSAFTIVYTKKREDAIGKNQIYTIKYQRKKTAAGTVYFAVFMNRISQLYGFSRV